MHSSVVHVLYETLELVLNVMLNVKQML